MFLEDILSENNIELFFVGVDGSVEIGKGKLLVIGAGGTVVFEGGSSFGACTFDEDIGGACVDVEVVLVSCDYDGQGEEIAHRGEAEGTVCRGEVEIVAEVFFLEVS